MSSLSHAYVAVRDLHADGGPAAPAGWDRAPQGTTGWTMITHPSGALIAALRVNAVGARGLFALFGPQALLEAIAAGLDEMMPGREAYRRGLAGEATPLIILRAWRWWRCDVIERDEGGNPKPKVADVRRQLTTEGTLLPNPAVHPLPWDLDADGRRVATALAVRRVTALRWPALGHVLAGRGSDVILEDEPDRAIP